MSPRKLPGPPGVAEGLRHRQRQHILDVHDLAIADPVALERDLNQIAGVVTVGFFATRPADILAHRHRQRSAANLVRTHRGRVVPRAVFGSVENRMFSPQPPWMGSRAVPKTALGTIRRATGSILELAGGLGFEPRLTESESVVLPLDDPPTSKQAALPVAGRAALALSAWSTAVRGGPCGDRPSCARLRAHRA